MGSQVEFFGNLEQQTDIMYYLASLCCLVLALRVGFTAAATTPGTTHQHHEHPEKESFNFYYDGHTQMLIVHNSQACYLWVLTPDELNGVHTDSGLRNIELRVFKVIDSAYYTVVPSKILSSTIIKACAGSHSNQVQHTNFFL